MRNQLFLVVGTEYTPQPENAAGGSSSPEDVQNIRGVRYYTPERLPHILHTIAADYLQKSRRAEDIRARILPRTDRKSPRRRAAAGVNEKPRREYPDGVSCQSFVVGLVWLLVFSCRAY